jgi:hypothetical protein
LIPADDTPAVIVSVAAEAVAGYITHLTPSLIAPAKDLCAHQKEEFE